MTTTDRLVGLAVGIVATFAIAWCSQVPGAAPRTDDALLRLTWRARPERIEHCVTATPEALAAMPPHMRQTTVCEGISASYRLEVRHDDRVVAERHVKPGGLRGDRPLYVFLEIPVPAGDATIRVAFTRVETPSATSDQPDAAREALTEAVPASLVWEQRLSFADHQVRIISYDPERRTLFEVREP